MNMILIFCLSPQKAKSYYYAVSCLGITTQKLLPENGVLNRVAEVCIRGNLMLKNITGSISSRIISSTWLQKSVIAQPMTIPNLSLACRKTA